jgi:hypothetical protein
MAGPNDRRQHRTEALAQRRSRAEQADGPLGRDEAAPEVEGYAWAVSFNPFTYLDAIELDSSRG